LPQPKGLFLLGVQGCGKSLMAKAAAGYWRLPLLRMDVASLVSQSSGSEPVNLMVDALKIADSLAPVVLWLDEIEKAFSGVQKDGHLARNFGAFITWMQEKKSSVFVVATANFVQNLPPELLRKGRFDEIFFVDLPNIHERKEIFQIHLKNRGRKAEQFPIEDLAIKSEGYSGAEIEQVIIDGMFIAFGESRDLEPRDILESLDETVPLSTTMEESIKDLKEWANTRARRASTDTKRIDYFK
jgi:SpoVK/Ycf46/Vps4 family AAA+-type ATPase